MTRSTCFKFNYHQKFLIYQPANVQKYFQKIKNQNVLKVLLHKFFITPVTFLEVGIQKFIHTLFAHKEIDTNE